MFIKKDFIHIFLLLFFIFMVISCEPNERTLLSQKDVCNNVDCSGTGVCKKVNNKAICECSKGYYSKGLECYKSECSECSDNEKCENHVCKCKDGYKKYDGACFAYKSVFQFGNIEEDSVSDIKIFGDNIYIIGNYDINMSLSKPFLMISEPNFTILEKVKNRDFESNSYRFQKFDINSESISVLGVGYGMEASYSKTGYIYDDISKFSLLGEKLEFSQQYDFQEERECSKSSECNSSEVCINEICEFVYPTKNCNLEDKGKSRCVSEHEIITCVEYDQKYIWKNDYCSKNCVEGNDNDECSNGTPYQPIRNGVITNTKLIADNDVLYYSGYYVNQFNELNNEKNKEHSFININSGDSTREYKVSKEGVPYDFLVSQDMIKTENFLVMLSSLVENDKNIAFLTFLSLQNVDSKINIKLDFDKNIILYSIVQNSEGDYYAAGLVQEKKNFTDIIIVKINQNRGVITKNYIYGVENEIDEAVKIAINDKDELYVLGFTNGALKNNKNLGSRDIFLSKFDKELDHKWTTQFGTKKTDIPKGIAVKENDIWIIGETRGAFPYNTNQGKSDIFLMNIEQ